MIWTGAGVTAVMRLPTDQSNGGWRLNKPFPAYQGEAPYIFICYSHQDADAVYADLLQLHQSGIHIWYDEGIEAGKSWRAEIARAIREAERLIFFISGNSINSTHCLREVDFALHHDVPIVPVYLDDTELPEELALVLNRVQALFRHRDSRYADRLLIALRGRVGINPFGKRTTRRRGLRLLAAAGVMVVALTAWLVTTTDGDDASGAGPALTTTAPSAYDAYLEGLELVERWDEADNLARAIELFRAAANLDPNFALTYARLADALRINYGLSGDPSVLDDAMAQINEAVRLNANLAPVQTALGRLQLTRGNVDLAFAAVEQALRIDANDAAANQAMASVFERLGRQADAEASFRRALALDPERVSTLNAFGNFLFRQSRFDEAAAQWQTVVRLAPNHYTALVNLGAALNETGRIAEAITVYQRAIEIQPTYMAYSNLGTAYSRGERYAEAVAAYRNALTIDESNWLAWGNLAYVYSLDQQTASLAAETFDQAIALAEAARQQNLRDPFVHSDLALYYAMTGQPELALQRLSTTLTLAPDSGEILAAAAEIQERLGQRDDAVAQARRALELGYPRQRLQRNPGLTNLMMDVRLQPGV